MDEDNVHSSELISGIDGDNHNDHASAATAPPVAPAAAPQQQRSDFWNNPRPTNENPNFVRDYFASSRLHFIGSFRARYESMMVQVGIRLAINPSILLHDANPSKNVISPSSIIVHVDMDAFFANVAVRDNPQLKGQPVAVCHDAGEISSCTYEARKFGVRAGMFLREARKLCPTLKFVPYDFNAYEKVSIQIYTLFHQLSRVRVEAVSVDEAYLDITDTISVKKATSQTGSFNGDAENINSFQREVEDLIRSLRNRIFEETGCTASAGIGPSKLIARLATKRAKPNGQFFVLSKDVADYIDSLKLGDLPGIGYRTGKRMTQELNIHTIPQLRAVPLVRLKQIFGDRQGESFHEVVRGIDKRPVQCLKPRRSIGAELSWGVRFLSTEDDKVVRFISEVAGQVALRVTAAGAFGTRVTYKVYKRIRGADASHYKHLGHGPCTIISKSAKLPSSRLSGNQLKDALELLCHQLHKHVGIEHEDFRGIGIQVMDLVFSDLKLDQAPNSCATKRIDSFFKAATRNVSNPNGSNLSSARTNNRSEVAVIDELDEIRPANVERNVSEAEENIREAERTSDHVNAYDPAVNIAGEDSVSRTIDQVDIPTGWDRSVFENLPDDIQRELLKAEGSRPARRQGPQQLTLGQLVGVRRRGGNAGTGGREVVKRRKRGGGGLGRGQVTMTQLREIDDARRRGNLVIDASEFRARPLRDVVELLEDLKGQGSRLGLPGAHQNHTHSHLVKSQDIPSPPPLSSDEEAGLEAEGEESDGDFEETVQKAKYFSDDLTLNAIFAQRLHQWMRQSAARVSDSHMDVLRTRFSFLLRRGFLQRLCDELRTIRRFVTNEDGELGGWKGLFNSLLEEVQEECRAEYYFGLSVGKIG